jgi:hypothetical protein
MTRSPLTPGSLALALLFVLAPAARADFIPWMYNWSRSPSELHADAPGTGYIALTDESLKGAVGDSDIVATNMRTFSTATPQNPDHFTHKAYTLSLFLLDSESGKSGTLTFTGEINGDLGAAFSRLTNTFTGPATETIVLGQHRYTASNLTFSPPGIPGAVNAGSISAHATITVVSVEQLPEPASLALSGFGMFLLGVVRWQFRRRGAVPEQLAT